MLYWLQLTVPPVIHTHTLSSRCFVCVRVFHTQLQGESSVGHNRLSSNWWPAKKNHWFALQMDNWPVSSQSTSGVCTMLASWTNEDFCAHVCELKFYCQFGQTVHLLKSFVCSLVFFCLLWTDCAPDRKKRHHDKVKQTGGFPLNSSLSIISSLAINLLNCLSFIFYHHSPWSRVTFSSYTSSILTDRIKGWRKKWAKSRLAHTKLH